MTASERIRAARLAKDKHLVSALPQTPRETREKPYLLAIHKRRSYWTAYTISRYQTRGYRGFRTKRDALAWAKTNTQPLPEA